MADSNITKRALASALKELMEKKSFSKISVADICKKCDMNRKSFYYHFRDKYDLVNWIFDTEFIAVVHKQDTSITWDILAALCTYFYDNRVFYKKALSMEGQNSFSDHFRELLYTSIRSHLRVLKGAENATDFQVNFFADAATLTFQRWILDKNCMKPDEFLEQLKLCIQCMAAQYSNLQ